MDIESGLISAILAVIVIALIWNRRQLKKSEPDTNPKRRIDSSQKSQWHDSRNNRDLRSYGTQAGIDDALGCCLHSKHSKANAVCCDIGRAPVSTLLT